MSMREEDIMHALRLAFPSADIALKDLAGDGDHYQVTIASEAFKGLSRVAQHKLVYAALEGKMGTVLHALEIHAAEK